MLLKDIFKKKKKKIYYLDDKTFFLTDCNYL